MIVVLILILGAVALVAANGISVRLGRQPSSLLTRTERLTGIESHLAKLQKHLSHPNHFRSLSLRQVEELLAERRDAMMRKCDQTTIKNQQFLRRFEESKSRSNIEGQAYERLRLDP